MFQPTISDIGMLVAKANRLEADFTFVSCLV